MRNGLAHTVLRIAAAFRVRTATAALATGVSVVTGASPVCADRYGPWAEDLLLRPGLGAGDLAELVTWAFYGLAVFVGGWAVLRLKTHFDVPKPGAAPLSGGLAMPVVGMLAALALLAAPWALNAFVESLGPGYRPPVWPAE